MTKKAAPTNPAPEGAAPSGVAGIVDQERLDRLDALADKATSQYGGQEPAKVDPPAEPKVERELVNQPRGEDGKFLPKDPEAKVEPAAEEPAPVAEAAPETPAAEPAPAPELYEIKVNGKTLKLTKEELIARAQKIESADDYLRQAAEFRKATVKQEPAPEPKAPASVEDDDAALARAIQMGTEQDAVEAIRKLRARPPVVPTDDVLRIVNTQLAIQEANRKFETDYSDIAKDPNLMALVTVEMQKRIQQRDPRSYQENLMEVAESVKTWKASLVPQSAQVQAKEARKASVTVIPTAAARAANKTEEKPETHADVIAEMAKQRNAR